MLNNHVFLYKRIAMRFQYIVSDPKVLGRKSILKDTRISVEFIIELVASGGLVKNIVNKYPRLKEEAVRAAILFTGYNLRNDAILEVTVAPQ